MQFPNTKGGIRISTDTFGTKIPRCKVARQLVGEDRPDRHNRGNPTNTVDMTYKLPYKSSDANKYSRYDIQIFRRSQQ